MSFIATFYSFKGGVGRTMALANIAVLLAQRGLRVLAVDWDLEAPGLERYFHSYNIPTSREQEGLLDLFITASKSSGIGGKPKWQNYVVPVNIASDCHLSLLMSGRRDETYPSKVLNFHWDEFFAASDGGNFIESLREDWLKEFDITLVDSRTGITDSGGICTIQIPDVLIPVFTTTEQSLQGAKEVVLAAQRARQKLAFDRMPLLVFPLPSRFDSRTQYKEAQEWLRIFAQELKLFYDDWLPASFTPLQILERTKIPYIAYFSFGENLPVVTEGTSDPEGLGYAYMMAASLLEGEFQNAEYLISGELVSMFSHGKASEGLQPITENLLSFARDKESSPLSHYWVEVQGSVHAMRSQIRSLLEQPRIQAFTQKSLQSEQAYIQASYIESLISAGYPQRVETSG